MITRGDTPVHTFEMGTDLTKAELVFLTYEQPGISTIEKTKGDLQIMEKKIYCQLSQEDTLSFSEDGPPVNIQFRYKMSNGNTGHSKIIQRSVGKILKDGVI